MLRVDRGIRISILAAMGLAEVVATVSKHKKSEQVTSAVVDDDHVDDVERHLGKDLS